MPRQINREDAPLAGQVAHTNRPAVRFDAPLADAEPEPETRGTGSVLLGRAK
jgi:hypothetical protein